MQTSAEPQLALGLAPQPPLRISGWPADLRALTLTPPWGFAMTRAPLPGRKLVENRTWPPIPALLRGDWFMLHSGVGYDAESANWISHRIGQAVPTKAALRAAGELGALVAFARLVRLTQTLEELPESQREWRMTGNRYGWLLDVRPLEKSLLCMGWHKLWRVSPRVSSAEVKHLRGVFDEMKLAEAPLLRLG